MPLSAAPARVRTFSLAALIVTAGALSAQSGSPRFDLVSIRAIQPTGQPVFIEANFDPVRSGGHYVNPHAALLSLISFAYDVKDPSRRLIGLPKWAGQMYSVTAKASDTFPVLPPRENREQVRLMVRHMLEDRFRLKLHVEKRQEDALVMTVEKGGLKMKEAGPPVAPEPTDGRVNVALSDRGGRMIATKGTMRGLAQVVGLFMKQEVIDETGLSGYYDFDFRWESPATDAPPSNTVLGVEGLNLFLSEVKDRFGLRFTKRSAAIDYWIIDSVDLPTENP